MFILSINMIWNFTFFFYYFYLIFIISLILYCLPIFQSTVADFKYRSKNNFFYLTGFDTHFLLLTPISLLALVLFSWNSNLFLVWFGHLLFTSFQLKITYFVLFSFLIIVSIYSTTIHFTNKETFDYLIVCFNFFIWIVFLFYSNTIFTTIFFIEILSTLIFFLLITSTFSTTYFYKNLNLSLHNYFSSSISFPFIQSLLFFFWISLISSLNLFLFLFLFYLKFMTFDWNLFEFLYFYIFIFDSFKELTLSALIWFNLLFCIFLKCGMVPFYFWKPTFFKGLPLHTLMFYIVFFYFFIFLYFLYFLLFYLNEVFYSYLQINMILLLCGFILLFFILCEAYYIKTFLALSSILNSLFIFLTINGFNSYSFFF